MVVMFLTAVVMADPSPATAPQAQPRADGRDRASFDRSILAMLKEAPPQRRTELENAIQLAVVRQMKQVEVQLRKDLDGKTADEIIALGAQYAAEDPEAAALNTRRQMQARTAAALSMLQSLRSQHELYRLNHQDRILDVARYPNWEQLLGRSDEDGILKAEGKYGPYLASEPVNPLRKAFKLKEVPATEVDQPVADAEIGWLMADGRLYLLDPEGRRVKTE